MGCCLPKKKNDLATVWRFIPLAAYVLIFANLQMGFPLASLIMALKHNELDKGSAAAILTYVFNGIQIVLGFVVCISVLAKWVPGLKLYEGAVGYIIFSWFAYIGSLIVFVVRTKRSNKPAPDATEMATTASAVIMISILVCVLAFFLRSCIASLIMVLQCGGNGFESLNYKQLKTGVYDRAFTREDGDEDSISDDDQEP